MLRRTLMESLPDRGASASLIRQVEEMDEFDLYDVLAELGYGLEPKTRLARADAFDYKHADWLGNPPCRHLGDPPRAHSPLRSRRNGGARRIPACSLLPTSWPPAACRP